MTTKFPARNTVMPLSKARRDLLPSFQQLQQTKNKSSVISSTHTSTNDTKVLNPISPTSTADTTDEDDDGDIFSTTPIVSFARLRQQHQQHGSDSLSQWDGDALYESPYNSVVTPQQIGSLAAMKELDIALDGVACATKNNDDNDDDDDHHDDHDVLYRSNSEANYSIGEETAVTGNMSAFSSSNTPIMGSKCRRVTPRKTPELNLSSCREEEFPEPSTSRRLFMCGAVDVTTEIKGSFQDVNDTFRQILTTVRRFGPDEKDAVKDTLKDAQSFMKQRVLSGILGKNRCGGGAAAESHDDEDEESDLRDSPKHRDWDEKMRGRRSRNFTAHGDQTYRGRGVGKADNDDELPQESEEVVYGKSTIEIESCELKDLKVFEC